VNGVGTPGATALAPDRLVFFFSGFDPKGASFYHRLYREGALARSAFGDAHVDVGPRRRIDELASASDITWTPGNGDAQVHSRLHFMRWDDIVRRHWFRSPLELARDYLNVYGIGLPNGDFARIWRKSRPAWGMAIFPLVVAVLSLAISFFMLYTVVRSDRAFGPLACSLVAGAGAVLVWRMVVRRIDCEWLLRLYAFTQAQAKGALPVLEARMDAMADWIVARVDERLAATDAPPLREVMIVGYSTGSTVASSVLARALPRLTALLQGAGVAGRPALSMVTLGHCLPVAADWAAASGVRAELERLGACESLTWHDWSAPADWAAFWRTPPWPEGSRLRGVQRSPRFHATLSPAAYRALKRDRRQMHLQYLRAPGRAVEPSGYDWFRITAGPDPLEAQAVGSPAPGTPAGPSSAASR
jgi:hypothetical protein